VLIVGFVIQISTVLFDRVDTKLRWIDGLHTEIEVLEPAVNLAMALAVGILNPQLLDIGAPHDMVPVIATTMRLGLAEPAALLEGRLRDKELDLLPESLSLGGRTAEQVLELLNGNRSGINESIRNRFGSLLDLIQAVAEHMLGVLLKRSCRGSPEKNGRGGNLHGEPGMAVGEEARR